MMFCEINKYQQLLFDFGCWHVCWGCYKYLILLLVLNHCLYHWKEHYYFSLLWVYMSIWGFSHQLITWQKHTFNPLKSQSDHLCVSDMPSINITKDNNSHDFMLLIFCVRENCGRKRETVREGVWRNLRSLSSSTSIVWPTLSCLEVTSWLLPLFWKGLHPVMTWLLKSTPLI